MQVKETLKKAATKRGVVLIVAGILGALGVAAPEQVSEVLVSLGYFFAGQ